MEKNMYIIIMIISLLFITGCSTPTNTSTTNNTVVSENKEVIATTFFVTDEITRNIVGNNLDVELIIPKGISPHDYEPTPQQLVELSKSDILITLGGMFEHIEEEIVEVNSEIKLIESTHDVKTLKEDAHDDEHHDAHEEEHKDEICVEYGGTFLKEFNECEGINESVCLKHHGEFNGCASACRNDENAQICTLECVQVCKFESDHKEEHHDEHEEEHKDDEHHDEENEGHDDHHHHDDLEYDPHIWLSINNAILMTKEIEEQLIKQYPQYTQEFSENSKKYITQLEELQNQYSTGLNSCQKDIVIVNHKAFGYIAHEFDFKQVSAAGFAHEIEPTIQEIEEIIHEAQEHNVSVIYSEGGVNEKLSTTLAQEVGAKVLPLFPIAVSNDDTYLSIMKTNLENLKVGLECN